MNIHRRCMAVVSRRREPIGLLLDLARLLRSVLMLVQAVSMRTQAQRLRWNDARPLWPLWSGLSARVTFALNQRGNQMGLRRISTGACADPDRRLQCRPTPSAQEREAEIDSKWESASPVECHQDALHSLPVRPQSTCPVDVKHLGMPSRQWENGHASICW